ncbi:WD40 repeat-like protein [Imleria badia]|nr:WD40 repeat-like protein [Imleria badia]
MSSVTPSQRSEIRIPEPHRVISAPDDDISRLAYLPDGRRVVCRSDDGTIRVCNLENGEQEGTSMEHESGYVENLAVTGDGTRIISCDENGSIRVWDVESHELVREWTHPEGFPEITVSPDGRLIAVGSWDVGIYTMEGSHVNHSIKVGKAVWSLAFSPSGDKLACGTRSDVYVYDVENGTLTLGPLQGHEDCVHRMLWSLDGSRLFSASKDKTMSCWSSDTGEQLGQPWTHTSHIQSLSLSPDGSRLASASYDSVRFWDTISGSPITQHVEHDYSVNAVCFSASGEFVVSATRRGKIYLWRVPWLEPVESPAGNDTNLDIPNLKFILPDLSLGLDERQRIFELRLRKLLDLATSKGFHVSRGLFPSSLPVVARGTPLTGTERITDGDSNAMHTSPIEPSTSVFGSKLNGDAKKTHKGDKIKRKFVHMLRDIFFKGPRGRTHDHSM